MVELAVHFRDGQALAAQKKFLASHRLQDIQGPGPGSRGFEERGWARLLGDLPPEALARPCARLYLGSEFCPSLDEPGPGLGRALRLAQDSGFSATVVLGPVRQTVYARTLTWLRRLAPRRRGLEVVANDWGTLAGLAELGVEPVLGRLLFRVKRLPRLSRDTRPAPDTPRARAILAAQLRELSVFPGDIPWFAEFLRAARVRRMDTELVPQGLRAARPGGLRISLHLPWTTVTGGGSCPVAGGPGRSSRCARACRDACILPRYPRQAYPMVQIGHTVFAWMAALAPAALRRGIYDRTVLEPGFPM